MGSRTKHIDISHHFLRELHEDGSMIVKYTQSENNEANMMTNNVVCISLIWHRNHARNGAMFCYDNWDNGCHHQRWREDVKI